MILLQLLFTYQPAMNFMFHSAPLSVDSWIRILLASSLVMGIVGMEKWLVNRYNVRQEAGSSR